MTIKKGFICPNCSLNLPVTRTRRRANGIIDRKRKCGCGFVKWTREKVKETVISSHGH
jgi:hypothetical protein